MVASENRIMLVSNRLPLAFSIHADTKDYGFTLSPGGLAAGLSSIHQQRKSLWIGWPGEFKKMNSRAKERLLEQLRKENFLPIELSKKELQDFYLGFSNAIIWPLFHYLLDQLPTHLSGWNAYKDVNQKYADAIVKNYQPRDNIWIHDYQLMLVPGMVRQQLPAARIGFFLHIPFPSYEIFRILPWREEILSSLLGADLIGFHTQSYLRHFANCLLRVLGVETGVDRCPFEGREVLLRAFPMGIDARFWENLADDLTVIQDARAARENAQGMTTLMAVDRLDYTKGIVRRLKAFENLLHNSPDLRGKITLIQVAVPSRVEVPAYRKVRRHVEELVGKINGKFAKPFYQPVQYIFRSLSPRELAILYKNTDIMLVTPLRDGMNLVAKEFIACRKDDSGVLILSEFAGAASELGEAIIVNPYNLDETVSAIQSAIKMDVADQAIRMQALRKRVQKNNNLFWATSFLSTLEREIGSTEHHALPKAIDPISLAKQIANYQRILVLCDYDGTLVPIVRMPKLAGPDQILTGLLSELAAHPRISLHIVSGRTKEDLSRWFANLQIGLHAEHGFWYRAPHNHDWLPAEDVSTDTWKERVKPIFERYVQDTPGSFLEEKTCALGWHYRMSDPDTAAKMAKELRFHLHEATANLPVNVMCGKKIIEVRHLNCNKGLILKKILETEGEFDQIIAMGDDATDEDLFRSIPPEHLTILVGRSPSLAQLRFNNPLDVRIFLRTFLESSLINTAFATSAPWD